MTKSIVGGIGDAILSLNHAFEEKKCNLYTHQIGLKDFLERFDIEIQDYVQYNTVEEAVKKSTNKSKDLFEKDYYVNNNINQYINLYPDRYRKSKKGNNVNLAIHPFGSNFSNNFWEKRNQPIKKISTKFIDKIISDLSYSLQPSQFVGIFGSSKELKSIGSNDVFYSELMFNDLFRSFIIMSNVKATIATDSCIKSMSAYFKKPSVVFCGDYYDEYRDKVFLAPYVKDGIMNVIKYKKENVEMYNYAIKTVKRWISL